MTFEKSGTKIEENVMWHEQGNKGCIKQLIKHKRINPLVKIIPIIFPPLVIPITLSLSLFFFFFFSIVGIIDFTHTEQMFDAEFLSPSRKKLPLIALASR